MSHLSRAQAVLDAEPQLYTATKLAIGPHYTAEHRQGHALWEVMHGTGHVGFYQLDVAIALVAELDEFVTLPQDISILEPKQLPSLTMKTAKQQLAPLGIRISFKAGEYRVVPQEATEAAAYYTDDLVDALNTGKAMAEQKLTRSKLMITVEIDLDKLTNRDAHKLELLHKDVEFGARVGIAHYLKHIIESERQTRTTQDEELEIARRARTSISTWARLEESK